MKGFKLLLALLIATTLLVVPVVTFAQEEATEEAQTEETKTNEADNRVTIYLFRGDGCPHCEEFEQWLDEIKGEYGQFYKVVDYETWYDQENADLMNKVAEFRNEADELGVPYILIGNQSWKGFTDSYKPEILDKIKSEYETPVADRYDAIALVNKGDTKKDESVVKASDVVIALVIVAVVCAGGFGLYQARKSTN